MQDSCCCERGFEGAVWIVYMRVGMGPHINVPSETGTRNAGKVLAGWLLRLARLLRHRRTLIAGCYYAMSLRSLRSDPGRTERARDQIELKRCLRSTGHRRPCPLVVLRPPPDEISRPTPRCSTSPPSLSSRYHEATSSLIPSSAMRRTLSGPHWVKAKRLQHRAHTVRLVTIASTADPRPQLQTGILFANRPTDPLKPLSAIFYTLSPSTSSCALFIHDRRQTPWRSDGERKARLTLCLSRTALWL